MSGESRTVVTPMTSNAEANVIVCDHRIGPMLRTAQIVGRGGTEERDLKPAACCLTRRTDSGESSAKAPVHGVVGDLVAFPSRGVRPMTIGNMKWVAVDLPSAIVGAAPAPCFVGPSTPGNRTAVLLPQCSPDVRSMFGRQAVPSFRGCNLRLCFFGNDVARPTGHAAQSMRRVT